MKNKKHIGEFWKGSVVGVVVTSFIIIGIFFGTDMRIVASEQGREVSEKIKYLEEIIDQKYLYSDGVDKKALEQGIYKGYLMGLGDTYSVYYDKEEYKSLLEATSGRFFGIGAVFFKEESNKEIVVKKTYENAPAQKAGLKPGDLLKSVNGKSVDGKSLELIVKEIQGDKGTVVNMTLERDGKDYKVSIKRDEIIIDTIEEEIIDGNIGYISISEFTSDTYKQFDEALKALEKKGIDGLIIDLRNNPGGVVDNTCQILDRLLPKGKIVYTKDKRGKISEINSDEKNKFEKPIAVLINGNSASASEIFAGAIQDYGLGVIVGETSYGKGVVQQLLPLPDGTGIKLTVAEYFTPKDQRINGRGVKPDIKIVDDRTTNKSAKDNQLNRAIEEIKKKI